MKKSCVLFLLFIWTGVQAQPDFISLQEEWLHTVKAGESTSDFYWSEKNLIYSKINTENTEALTQFTQSKKLSSLQKYHHFSSFRHDDLRYVTTGQLLTESDSLLILTGWRDVDRSWKKEIDIILTQKSNTTEVSKKINQILNEERLEWVKLANKHNPEAHIKATYTKDATYFGNGQKSEGWQEIAERYFYMENPNYQVDLEKEQLWKLSDEHILEIGRYFTGSERVGTGGIYVILWQKQHDESWLIELDFNF
ncbi:hypothetical protein [Gracilimonas sp.]|uniref:YybH family protein n=1 Tax=Gracilimonas sp. TaxID=1974203 RepID=UPI0032EAEF43